jgi:hypothetical protein
MLSTHTVREQTKRKRRKKFKGGKKREKSNTSLQPAKGALGIEVWSDMTTSLAQKLLLVYIFLSNAKKWPKALHCWLDMLHSAVGRSFINIEK